ncbi:Glu-tRNA(Gln) amidotransferase subunit GatE [Candidatus Woesearchaeota archaeon]|nr:Glu-tRNA(Gln) amidotransferase subunit GatE [Candidatus Woesearchaeota archaeon]
MHKKLGLKCGIEIHQQLEGKKLFCSCPTILRDEEPDFTVRRKIRASAGESGKVDVAAAQEQLRNKTFVYQGYHNSTCLVETDSEPPHEINQDALYTSLQFCEILKSNISPVIQVMRKSVADGSNTSGFQRTALIARGGSIETSEGKVRVANVSLEEDSCKIVSESTGEKIYRLDRLGIPLIEIGTEPDITSPQQCLESAKKLGMLLRSLPGVKRGLGTIRQDVNVSIIGGTRVEIKGAQDLKQIPLLVELEMKRQLELLNLKNLLKGKKLNKLNIVDLSEIFEKCPSTIVKDCLKKKGRILGMKLEGLAGLVGKELQPNYRLGTEFSGRAKIKAGVGGIFHSDEMPNYGITIKDAEDVKKELKCKKSDAFILVATDDVRGKIALEAVYERAQELWLGVPKEVRQAQPDATSRYMRPMPGAARMYPETDVPLIRPVKNVRLPELLDVKISRIGKQYVLGNDLASLVVKSGRAELFEELAEKYKDIKSAFIADILTGMLVEIRRKYDCDTDLLTENDFHEILGYLAEDKIHKDIMLDVLIDKIKGNFSLKKYASLSTEKLHLVIKKIVEGNPKAPMGALMGMCMKELAGKASGKFISSELQKIMMKGHK